MEVGTDERAVDDGGDRSGNAPGAAGITRVAVIHENELFGLGLRASLTEDARLEVISPDEDPDVAVVSPRVALERSFNCPLIVCGTAPAEVAAGNIVLALLPTDTLTGEQLRASVQAAAAGLRVESPQAPVARALHRQRRNTGRESTTVGSVDVGGGSNSPGVEEPSTGSVSVEVALKAIADPQRQRILALVRETELSAGEIALHFDVSRPAISQHLQILKEAGVVGERREGTRRLYQVRPEGLAPVEEFLDNLLPTRLGVVAAGPVIGPARKSGSA